MSQSVFNRNLTKSTIADKIITQMEDEENPDMQVKFGGYMHGGKGFALLVKNLDTINEYTLELWKNIISSQGLESNIVTDMLGGSVKISCEPASKRQSNKKYMKSLMYLSITIFLIYQLWIRHHQE